MNNDLFKKIEAKAGLKNMETITKQMTAPRRDRGASSATTSTHTKGAVYQADLLRLPEDRGYKYALVVVDTYDRSIDAEPMKTTQSKEAVKAIKKIFSRTYLNPPILMIATDNGAEFKKEFHYYINDDLKIIHKYGKPYRSRQQAMVERFNYVLSKAISRYQNAVEISTGQPSTEWIDYLPKVVEVLNDEVVRENPLKNKNKGPLCREKKGDCELLTEGTRVRIPYEKPVDIINEKRHADSSWRVGDMRWTKTIHTIARVILRSNQPPLYLIDNKKNTAYTRSQLLLVDENEQQPVVPQEETYEVEKFIGKKKIGGLVHYKVKWKNYPASQANWIKRTELIKDLGAVAFKEFEKAF